VGVWNATLETMKQKPKVDLKESFGERIERLRKARGLTQEELAQKIRVTQRVIAYYEGETEHLPANLLVPLAKALRVSLEELLGLKRQEIYPPRYAALWRRLKKAETLSKKDQRAVLHYIEALAKNGPNQKPEVSP